MKVLIYGGGAVGLGLARALIDSGCETTIIDIEPTVTALKTHGIIQSGVLGDFAINPERFTVYDSILKADDNYDYICVCIKSYLSEAAAQDIASNYTHKQTPIVLFQNGWGNAEKFISYFDKERIFNARVMTGFMKQELYHVVITVHADAIRMGSLYDGDGNRLQALSKALTTGGMAAEVVNGVLKDIWAKMLYNCALNPLGALFNVEYGELGKSEYTKAIMNDIITEIFETMQRAGYTTHFSNAAEYSEVFYAKLLPSTAKHRSSMLQDIQAKRRTEIDVLNGAVVALAQHYGYEAKVNGIITGLIKFIESTYTGATG
ncbi:MAG TPA: 2-dehydropantoate 2-reductase [Spirochaetota bacterium]|nr:2-dehydropantoate 2-reductase [Spirochaetota bacterium]